MPQFKITDGINGDVAVTPNANSALIKYFKNLSDLSVDGTRMQLAKGLTLLDPAIKTVSADVRFTEPVGIGTSEVDLVIGGGLSGVLQIFKPTGPGSKLFDPDPYEDPISVALDDRYVSFAITASVNAVLGAPAGDLKFGFASGMTVTIANYRKFLTKPEASSVVAAVQETLAGFLIPADIEDIQAMSEGAVITLSGVGTLKFSASAELATALNPLASPSLPAPLPAVAIKAGGSITVGANVELTGDYQVRVTKTGTQRARLAYYRRAGEALAIKVRASAGVAAAVGGNDMIGKLMSAISSDPQADKDQLGQAGLPAGEIQGIQDAVKASIERTLELAVSAELGASHEHRAAFVYDLDLSALTAVSRSAIHLALDGDLSGLTLNPGVVLPGVAVVRDVFTNVREQHYSLTVNLLGIVNLGWVSKLVLSGKTMYEPATGQLIIADSASASRIGITMVNVGVADAQKLRHVMAETFLITAAYRGAKCAGLTPSLTTSHSFFALNQHTSKETLRDELDVSIALGLLDSGTAEAEANRVNEFGQTLYYAATQYDNSLSTLLFMDKGQARTVEFYEKAGLQAVAELVHTGDIDEARLRPTQDAVLWQQMKSSGQPGIKALFPGIPDPIVAAVIADYSLIRWWADAMHATGNQLAILVDFLAKNATVDDENNVFKKLRSDLAKHLQSVAATTKEDFGRPWGLLAMFIASDRKAGRRSTLIARAYSFSTERPMSHSL